MLPKHLDEKVARLHLDASASSSPSSRPSRPPTSACRSRARTSPTTTATRQRSAPEATSSSTCAGCRSGDPAASDIADPSLAPAGRARIEWADAQMPVLRSIRERLADERPLEGITVAACLHVTAETANLVRALIAGGAEVALCAANPLSTQDETAAALAEDFGAEVHARRGEDAEAYAAHVAACARRRPHVTLDDGADLVMLIHHARARVRERLIGGTEETTTGLLRVRALEAEGRLTLPGHRGQRGARRAHLQRPLRHRPVRARRHPARDEHPARRPDLRHLRLRLDRARPGPARARRRRPGGHLRGRSRARPGGADGGLRGHARAGGGRARRRLRHRHRLARGAAPRALRAHEGRRDPGQRRALRRRDRPRRAARRGRRGPRRPAARRSSTTSASGG